MKSKENLNVFDSKGNNSIHIFTSAAVNYLPKVRILCESLKTYHPEAIVHLALPDQLPEWLNVKEEPFDNVITFDHLDIPNKDGWIFQHELVELSTGIKPFVAQYLFKETDCEYLLYFDPDIVLFDNLGDLLDEFNHGSILLTPHLVYPQNNFDEVLDNEINSVLKHGVYNFGFFGVRNDLTGRKFIDWWADRLYYFCIAAKEHGLFVDQKWIDMVPAIFDKVRIIRDTRFNVATWNLSTRELSGDLETGLLVDEKPLGFYHFTGFDSGDHEVMQQKHAGGNTTAFRLVQWYKKSIKSDPRATNTPWVYRTFSNQAVIAPEHRLIYRKRKDLQQIFPNPFVVVAGEASYHNWFEQNAKIEHPYLFEEKSGINIDDVRYLIMASAGKPANVYFPRDLGRMPELLSKLKVLYKKQGIRGVVSRVLKSFRIGA